MATADPAPHTSAVMETESSEVRSGLVARHEVTHDTGLVLWGYEHSCVMSDGSIVITGKTLEDAPAEIHVYDKHGQKIKTIKLLCQHQEGIYLLSLTINNTEYLMVSCANCNMIRLHNPDMAAIITAFHNNSYRPGPMCHGSSGTVCVVNIVNGRPVLILDCTTVTFQLKHTVQTNMENSFDICYIPVIDVIVISDHSPRIIRSVSCSSNKILWEVTGSVDGAACHPHRMVYSDRYHFLLAADGNNRRILVLQPESGRCLQAIDLSQRVDIAWEPHLHEDHLILRHLGTDYRAKISYYTIKGPKGWEYWETAYKEICLTGVTESNRVKLNAIGYTTAGKSSFIRSLLSKPFLENIHSTEGIHTELIKITFDTVNQVLGHWTEITLETPHILKGFNSQILSVVDAKRGLMTEGPQTSKTTTKISKVAHGAPSMQVTQDSSSASTTESHTSHTPNTAPEVSYIEDRPTNTEDRCVVVDARSIQSIQGSVKEVKHVESAETKECLIRIWDFGGQLEFYATHHLFLDANAINLIVMDITKCLHEVIHSKYEQIEAASIPRTAGGFLDYWLNTIHAKATSQGITPSVALVLTHIDQFTSSTEEYISKILTYISNKPYTNYITREKIFTVDNKTGTTQSFLELRKKIFQMATLQKTWGLDRPTRWLKAEASIMEEAETKSVKYLTIDTVQNLTSKVGMSKQETESFLDFHNAMGNLVYFNQKELKHIVFADPQWLVDMFKAVITPHSFLDERNIESSELKEFRQRAVVTHTLLETLWKGNDIHFLINIMQKFHLLVPISYSHGTKYLIPCMLPPRKMNMYETVPFKNMNMMYSSFHIMKELLSIGDFHRIVAKFAESTQWRICEFDHLTYTDVSFKYQPGVRIALTMLKDKDLHVSVWFSKLAKQKGAVSALPLIQKEILKNPSLRLKDDRFLLACPDSIADRDSDTITGDCLMRFKAKPHEAFILEDKQCPIHKNIVRESNYKWFLCPIHTFPSEEGKQPPMLKSLGIDSLQKAGYIVAVPSTSACTVTSPNSDVTLQVPEEAAQEVVIGRVYTDTSMFRHLIPDDECQIAPIVQYRSQSIDEHDPVQSENHLTLSIPHCVSDANEVEHKVRVRYGDIHDTTRTLNIASEKKEGVNQEVSYEIDSKYIRIHSTQLTGFIDTLQGSTCYSKSSTLRVYTSLGKSYVKLKPILCSALWSIRDYSTNIDGRLETSMELIEVARFPVITGATLRRVKITVLPEAREEWDELHSSINVPEDKFRGYHMCDHEPLELPTYIINSKTPDQTFFQGTMTVEFQQMQYKYPKIKETLDVQHSETQGLPHTVWRKTECSLEVKLELRKTRHQTIRRLKLQCEVTHDTGLVLWGYEHSCVMSDGSIVITGKTSEDAPAEIHMYDKHGQKIKTIKPLCQHEKYINLLPLIINNTEYLTVSCLQCRMICLHNPDTAAIITAFHNTAYRPGPMCRGQPGTVCVVNMVQVCPVLILDCTTVKFQLKHTVQTNMENCCDICYISTLDILLIASPSAAVIRAVSCFTDKLVWEVTGEVDGSQCEPHGVVYSPQHDVVFVCDGRNLRILVLEPTGGRCLQTVDLGQHGDIAWLPHLHEDHLILVYSTDRKPKISYYTAEQEESSPVPTAAAASQKVEEKPDKGKGYKSERLKRLTKKSRAKRKKVDVESASGTETEKSGKSAKLESTSTQAKNPRKRKLKDDSDVEGATGITPGSTATLSEAPPGNMDQLQTERKELKPEHLVKLSERITDKSTRRTLGGILGLKDYELDAIEKDNESETTLASFRMLQKWYRNTENRFTARDELAKALKKAGLKLFIADVLEVQYDQ